MNANNEYIFDEVVPLDDLTEIVTRLSKTLKGSSPFCLWLMGDLGAGKTTLTSAVLHSWGLDSRIPVTSPTYTYLNDYKIGTQSYAHLDLYRADGSFSPEDIGMTDVEFYNGVFIEWPKAIPENPFLNPTHTLEIFSANDGENRRYRLSLQGPK